MKKLILLLFLFATGLSAFAQINRLVTPQTKLKVVKGPNLVAPLIRPNSDYIHLTPNQVGTPNAYHHPDALGNVRGLTTSYIGTTTYDLQTNGSISTRLWKNADKLSAVWTYATEDGSNGYPERGTGYNYYDGTTWGALPTSRIESQRTGFTNIVVNGSGGEVVVAHNTEISQVQETSRNTQGSGAWTENASNLASTATNGNLWSKETASGNNLHVIAVTTPTGTLGGDPYHGQDGALLYSRSTDGGQTWDIQNKIIPEIDSSFYLGFTSDQYQIDANGNTVAIVVGDNTTDMILLKSTDNGNTWTKTIVWQFPVPMYDDATLLDVNSDGVPDTVLTTDAAPAVLVDNQGMAHVWFGAMFIDNDGVNGLKVFLGTNALLYWDETMGTDSSILCAEAQDLNGNDTIDFANFGRFANEGLCSGPSPGIDASGTLYVTYSALVENTADDCGKSIRHTYVSKSTDGGQTWLVGKDISPDPLIGDGVFSESVYGAMAKTVDDNINVIFQQDFFAGTAVLTDLGGAQIDPCNVLGTTNDIVHVQFPTSELTGISSADDSMHMVTLYPNPSDGIFNVAINSPLAREASISIMNSMGQVVKRFQEVPVVSNEAHLNVSDLTNGMYYLSVTNSNGTSIVTFNITH